MEGMVIGIYEKFSFWGKKCVYHYLIYFQKFGVPLITKFAPKTASAEKIGN